MWNLALTGKGILSGGKDGVGEDFTVDSGK